MTGSIGSRAYGMMVGHSTGTTGKLSFIPRSLVEWPAWKFGYTEATRASTGVDSDKGFSADLLSRLSRRASDDAEDDEPLQHPGRGWSRELSHAVSDHAFPRILMSLAGRMQSAEDKGELDRLGLDPVLLQSARGDDRAGTSARAGLEAWFYKLIEEFRGQTREDRRHASPTSPAWRSPARRRASSAPSRRARSSCRAAA